MVRLMALAGMYRDFCAVLGIQDTRADALGNSRDAFHPQHVVGVIPAVGTLGNARTRSHRNNDSRTQLFQALEVAAIQGQRINRLVAYGSAQSGIGGVYVCAPGCTTKSTRIF